MEVGGIEMGTWRRPMVPNLHNTAKPRHVVSEILSIAKQQQQHEEMVN